MTQQRDPGAEPETVELTVDEYQRLQSDADAAARATEEAEKLKPMAQRERIRSAGYDPDSTPGRVLAELAKTDPGLTSTDAFRRKATELGLDPGQAPPPSDEGGGGYRPPWFDDPDDVATKVHRRNAELARMAADAAAAGEAEQAARAARQEALDRAGAEYAGGGDGLTALQREIVTSGESLDNQIRRAREANDFMLASALERKKARES